MLSRADVPYWSSRHHRSYFLVRLPIPIQAQNKAQNVLKYIDTKYKTRMVKIQNTNGYVQNKLSRLNAMETSRKREGKCS